MEKQIRRMADKLGLRAMSRKAKWFIVKTYGIPNDILISHNDGLNNEQAIAFLEEQLLELNTWDGMTAHWCPNYDDGGPALVVDDEGYYDQIKFLCRYGSYGAFKLCFDGITPPPELLKFLSDYEYFGI